MFITIEVIAASRGHLNQSHNYVEKFVGWAMSRARLLNVIQMALPNWIRAILLVEGLFVMILVSGLEGLPDGWAAARCFWQN